MLKMECVSIILLYISKSIENKKALLEATLLNIQIEVIY